MEKKGTLFSLLIQVRVFRRSKCLVPAHPESLQQNQTLNPWTQSLGLNSALLHPLKEWLYCINSSYFSASRGNKLLFSSTADPWPRTSFHRELCEGEECNGIKNGVVLLWYRAHCRTNPRSPSGWDGMEISGAWSRCFSSGRNTVSIFGEIGSHIQERGQEVPGSAGRVRGLDLTPCGYSTLIITTSAIGDPESIWWSPRDKQWMRWHSECLCWFQPFNSVWIRFSRFIFFQCSL